MNSSSPAPKLPMWIFFATDVVLLAAAAWIAHQSAHPMPEGTTAAIVACIIAGAVAALVPLVVFYERQKNETLDDRQRALEGLARTVAESAEQISIAAGGLHEIADLAQRNLKHAEQLPHKLQEKIAEFQAQLANATDAEKEELEKEIEELRASETDRLQSTADRIARTTGDFAKLETTLHQHLIAANEALSKLSFGTASAIGKAQVAAEQALGQARQESARGVEQASRDAIQAIHEARQAAVAELSAQVDSSLARLKAATAELSELTRAVETAAKAARSGASTEEPAAVAPEHAETTPAPEPAPAKRNRKRREEPAATGPETASATSGEPTVNGAHAPAEPATADSASAPTPVVESTEPAEATATPSEVAGTHPSELSPAESPSEPAPTVNAAPETNGSSATFTPEPEAAPAESVETTATESMVAAGEPAPAPTATEASASEPAADVTSPAPAPEIPAEPAKPARKRGRRVEDDQPALGLEIEEPTRNGGEAGVVERVLSSDGATRLIVTAYIGIGNRLFIRGEGPGLSWDKGVPLQFVSIGKWRWETNDANGPVQFKLFKNDEHESAGLGALTIEPGYQHEVTANF